VKIRVYPCLSAVLFLFRPRLSPQISDEPDLSGGVCARKKRETTMSCERNASVKIRVYPCSSAVLFIFCPRVSPQIPDEPDLSAGVRALCSAHGKDVFVTQDRTIYQDRSCGDSAAQRSRRARKGADLSYGIGGPSRAVRLVLVKSNRLFGKSTPSGLPHGERDTPDDRVGSDARSPRRWCKRDEFAPFRSPRRRSIIEPSHPINSFHCHSASSPGRVRIGTAADDSLRGLLS